MDKGVLTIETDFSKSDFTIEWKDVREIYTATRFLIRLKNGELLSSNLQSLDSGKVYITGGLVDALEVFNSDIVDLEPLNKGFWSRLDASVDVGYNLTKANNLEQINFQVKTGYLTQHWRSDLYFQEYRSTQDSIAPTTRKEAGATYSYFLAQDWFIIPQVTYLSNTEQALRFRLSPNLGIGRYLIRNNNWYWGVLSGLTFNAESFTNETNDKRSGEFFAGTEVNIFDLGDLDLLTNFALSPSFTEKGRIRYDFKFDGKLDIADDFYIRANITFNYDNQPAIVGNEKDYVFGISIGYEKD